MKIGKTYSKKLAPRKCIHCGDLFHPKGYKSHYCSKPECQRERNRQTTRALYHKTKEQESKMLMENGGPNIFENMDSNIIKITYYQKNGLYGWKAIFKNGKELWNGGFHNARAAFLDMESATK